MSGPMSQTLSRRVWLAAAATLLLPAPSRAQQAPEAELLMFDDPGCPWCRRWHAEVGPGYPKSAEGQRAPLRIVQLRDGVPVRLKLKGAVRATPTFVLVQDGQEVGRITGYPGADFFWPMLGNLLLKLTPGQRT
jgi:hypothetical protein